MGKGRDFARARDVIITRARDVIITRARDVRDIFARIPGQEGCM